METTVSDIDQSPTLNELATALAAAQSKMQNPVKDRVNPFFKSLYADLASVRDAVLPVLTDHGLSVVQLPCVTGSGAPGLRTVLMHKSGEWIGSTMLVNPVKNDPQGMGSALTYARRYALQSLVGVAAEEDDDGNAGTKPSGQQRQDDGPPDAAAVAEHLAKINAAKNTTELNAAGQAVSADARLTEPGRVHLREQWARRQTEIKKVNQ